MPFQLGRPNGLLVEWTVLIFCIGFSRSNDCCVVVAAMFIDSSFPLIGPVAANLLLSLGFNDFKDFSSNTLSLCIL